MIRVRFTISRWDVLGCLADLGDLAFQTRIWGRRDTSEGFYDTFDEVVNLLDDLAPSPPRAAVPWTLVDGPEVGRLADLWRVLDSLLDELGDAEFEEYLRHPRWLEVVRAARAALCAMVIAGPFETSRPEPDAAAGRWEVMGAVGRLADREYQDRVWVRGRAWQPTDPLDSFELAVSALLANRVLPEPSEAKPGVLVDDAEVARLLELGQALSPFLDKRDEVPFSKRIREPARGDVIDGAWSALYELIRKGPIRSGPEPLPPLERA